MRGALFAGLFVAAAALFSAAPARADYFTAQGYPCRVSYSLPTPPDTFPIGPTTGQHGAVTFQLYSGAHCTGSYLRMVTIHSTGSNVGSFTGSSTTFRESILLAYFEGLQRASEAGERIYIQGMTWAVNTFFTGAQVTFMRFGEYGS